MYKEEITQIKKQLQKGRWNLDEAISADNHKEAKKYITYARKDLEKIFDELFTLDQMVDSDIGKNEIDGILSNSSSGSVDLTTQGWLHLRLDTPLPNNKNSLEIKLISNTVTNLLNIFAGYYGKLPFYESAFVAIVEHRAPGDRGSYDHDNKAFRAIPNALKGRVFGDDNQFEMSLGMFTIHDEREIYCDIYVIPVSEIASFAAIYLNF